MPLSLQDLLPSEESTRFITSPGTSDPKFTKGKEDILDVVFPLHGALRGPDELQAPPLSDQEKRIIAQMKELAMGDPELSQMYSDFTLRALEGKEGVTPGLQRDIAKGEALTKEEIARGLGSKGARESTPGIRRLGRFREGANIAREDARRGAIGLGERLISSDVGRSITAAGAALGPLAQQRGLQTQIGLQNLANIRGTQAGQAGLLGQVGTTLLTSGKKKAA